MFVLRLVLLVLIYTISSVSGQQCDSTFQVWTANVTLFHIPLYGCEGPIASIEIAGIDSFSWEIVNRTLNGNGKEENGTLIVQFYNYHRATGRVNIYFYPAIGSFWKYVISPGIIVPLVYDGVSTYVGEKLRVEGLALQYIESVEFFIQNSVNEETYLCQNLVGDYVNYSYIECQLPQNMIFGNITININLTLPTYSYATPLGKAHPYLLETPQLYSILQPTITVQGRGKFTPQQTVDNLQLSPGSGTAQIIAENTLQVNFDTTPLTAGPLRMMAQIDGFETCIGCTPQNAPVVATLYPEVDFSGESEVGVNTVYVNGFGFMVPDGNMINIALDKGTCTEIQPINATHFRCVLNVDRCGIRRATSLTVNGASNPTLASNPKSVFHIKPLVNYGFSRLLVGSTLLTITGSGFGDNKNIISVKLKLNNTVDIPCTVLSVTNNDIVCNMPSGTDLPGIVTARVSCENVASDEVIVGELMPDVFKIDDNDAPLHPSARMIAITGNHFGTNATALSIEVQQPPSIGAEVLFVDETVAVVELQTPSDLPDGDLIITLTRHLERFNYTASARVAVVSDFSIGGGAIDNNEEEITIVTSEIAITGVGFEPHCHGMIGKISDNNSVVALCVTVLGCNDTHATCRIMNGSLSSGNTFLTLYKGGLPFSTALIGTVAPRPTVFPDEQPLITSSTRIVITAINTANVINKEDVKLIMDNNVAIDFDIINVTFFNNSLVVIECEIKSIMEAGRVVMASVGRAKGFSPFEQISKIIEESPVLFNTSEKLSRTTTSFIIRGKHLGSDMSDAYIQFLPYGHCDVGSVETINETDFLTVNNCANFSDGPLYAVLHRFTGKSNTAYIYTVVPPAMIEPMQEATPFRISRDVQNVTFFGFFDDPDSLVIEMKIVNELSSFSVSCDVVDRNNNSISCAVSLRNSGDLMVRVKEHYAWTNWTKIASVYSPPVIYQRTAVAINATYLIIRGLNFDRTTPPNVQLYFWGGPSGVTYDVIDISLDYSSIRVECEVNEWSDTHIRCDGIHKNITMPMNQTGVYWAEIESSGHQIRPTVVADLVMPPKLNQTDSLLAKTATRVELIGTGFDLALTEVFVTLKDSSPNSPLIPCEVESVMADMWIICTADLKTTTEGPLMAQLLSYGATTDWVQIATILPAPVLNIPTNMINLAASVHTLTVHGANFAANDNTIHFLLLRDKSSTQFDCVSVEAISSSELLCYMPDILSESDSGSQLYMAVSSHGGFALGGGLPNVSGRKRATNDIPLDAWHPLGIITPSPVIITNGALVSITTYTDTLTIYGKNFDGSGETLAVVFDKIGNIEPTCTIISATDTEIVCELSNLVEGTLRAVVYSFQGPSEAADVASIAPDTRVQIGLGVGIPTFALICGAAILFGFLAYRAYRRKRLLKMFSRKATEVRELMYTQQLTSVDHEDLVRQEAIKQWEIAKEDVTFQKEIGSGAFGKVWVGRWNNKKVAIKETKLTNPQARADFYSEVKLMLSIEPHRNVVRTYGVIIDNSQQTFWIVMEYLAGSLDKIVGNPENHAQLTEEEMIGFARDIAHGMAHLASLKIVHRDLAVRNILLSKDSTAKISDFGMSRVLGSELEGQTASTIGPIFWMSPEALMQKFSEKSDVWAYGVTLWEIVTGEKPYEGRDKLEVALQVRDEGLTLPIPKKCPKILASIMERCWMYNPAERPTFAEICNMLESGDSSN